MQNKSSTALRTLIYGNAFAIGFVIMGFEMVASRYMYPFFGGSITTWAALISTVLLALMTGYFTGGMLADRFRGLDIMGYIIIAAAFYIGFIPLVSEHTFAMIAAAGNDTAALLIAAMGILFIPIAFFGIFTPYSLRFLLHSTAESGKISGRIYGISTFGNVAGTLATTFFLIPHIGSINLTFLFSGITFLSGMSLLLFSRVRRINTHS